VVGLINPRYNFIGHQNSHKGRVTNGIGANLVKGTPNLFPLLLLHLLLILDLLAFPLLAQVISPLLALDISPLRALVVFLLRAHFIFLLQQYLTPT
jgi:hypothetical protein